MVWWQNADYEQKRETGDVTITWGLDLTGPITEELSWIPKANRAEAGRGAVGVAKRPASAHWRTP
jgi:hypothetical protein